MGFRTPSDATVKRIGTTTYYAAPKWTTVAPLTIGSSGGTALTLAGDNFTDTPQAYIAFGPVYIFDFTITSRLEAIVKTPAMYPFNDALAQKYELTVGLHPLSRQPCLDVPGSTNTRTYYAAGLTIQADDGSDFLTPAQVAGFATTDTPRILEVARLAGQTSGGTRIYVRGTGFERSSLSCRFGLTQAPATWLSNFQMLCHAPAMSAGFVAFEVINGLLTTSAGNQYLYFARAKVHNLVLPFEREIGGAVLPILGENFMQPPPPHHGGASGAACRVGTYPSSPTMWVSSSIVMCETPPAPPADYVVEVSNNDEDWTIGLNTITYTPSVEPSGIAPYRGTQDGGTPVTVTGAGFLDESTIECACPRRCTWRRRGARASQFAAGC